jgi:hypothetical protein
LKLYDFDTYGLNEGRFVYLHPGPTHNHTTRLIENHLDYEIIIGCRNPYSICVSMFRLKQLAGGKIISTFNIKDQFYEYILESVFMKFQNPWLKGEESENIKSLMNRVINHRVKLETFEDSLLKIPFISNSGPEKIAEVSKLSDEKLGDFFSLEKMKFSKEFFPKDFRLYYNQRNADLVYENYESMFLIMDYQKDSWIL